MSKRIEKDGKVYRPRRGKLVEIPQEWVGKTTDAQSIRKRRSKQTRPVRDAIQSHPGEEGYYFNDAYRRSKYKPELDEEEARELDELYGLDGW